LLQQNPGANGQAGTISIPRVYVGMGDKIPLGAAMNKDSPSRPGSAGLSPLLKRIEAGDRSELCCHAPGSL
jgi:hypothetical protein